MRGEVSILDEQSGPFDSSNAATQERPRIVQGGNGPVFVGSGSEDFCCVRCGHRLVSGYEPRALIAVDIQCFSCKEVSRTAEWPSGEPLPSGLITLGDRGAFLVGGPVDMTRGDVAFTCDQEIQRSADATGVRQPTSRGLDLSEVGLSALEAELSLLCRDFDICMTKIRRAHAAGNRKFFAYPLAWSVLHLREQLTMQAIDLSGPSGAAIMFLQLVLTLIDRWRHHPRFAAMAAGLMLEFPHTITQLLAASYLADHGNRIGFTEPPVNAGRSPDLFLNLGTTTRAGIEIKAPADLQWPQSLPSSAKLARVIEVQLKNAKGQLDAKIGGVVVLGSSVDAPDAATRVQETLVALIRAGKVSSRIAGVACVCIAPYPTAKGSRTGFRTSIASEVVVELNPKFVGQPILRT